MGRLKERLFDLDRSGWAKAFGGGTYQPDRDADRLASQLKSVYAFMSDGEWHTIAEIKERVGGTDASISSRLRDLRKAQFGSHVVDRRYVARGLFEYKLLKNRSAA